MSVDIILVGQKIDPAKIAYRKLQKALDLLDEHGYFESSKDEIQDQISDVMDQLWGFCARPAVLGPRYPDDEGVEDRWFFANVFEFDSKIVGRCSDCNIVLLDGMKQHDWPWNYAAGDDKHYKYVCYSCAQERKSKGEWCAGFESYYRNYRCEGCPEGGCNNVD